MKSSELLRRQLDSRLQGVVRDQPPRGGWIRAIRTALGMTMAQLGKRLGVSAPGIADLEKREASESITVARLRAAAEALGCDLVIVVVPRVPLADMVRQQATEKAAQEQRRLLHTMALENQAQGVTRAPDMAQAVARWVDKRGSKLWD
jgi:predicted DNA-binding mobile mystery protein A